VISRTCNELRGTDLSTNTGTAAIVVFGCSFHVLDLHKGQRFEYFPLRAKNK